MGTVTTGKNLIDGMGAMTSIEQWGVHTERKLGKPVSSRNVQQS